MIYNKLINKGTQTNTRKKRGISHETNNKHE